MFRDNVKLAIKNLRNRFSRSLLTLLGISIGIMAIISLLALGEGMQQAITGELSSLSDVVIVSLCLGALRPCFRGILAEAPKLRRDLIG